MKLKFLGAVGCVTGSCSLLEDTTSNIRFLVDCGMTQGEIDENVLNNAPWPYSPAGLSFVLLTHAHLDHCGLLGRLVRDGFSGPVYCTRFTAELARIVLMDAARLSGDLFTELDVRRIKFVAVDERPRFEFAKHFSLIDTLEVAFYPSAHIGGACSLSIRWRSGISETREIVFSGDVGPNSASAAAQPLLAPRVPLPTFPDYMVVESTYGSRVRDVAYNSSDARMLDLERIFTQALSRVPSSKGEMNPCVVIPAFSIHRAQELLVDLHALFEVRLRDQIHDIRPIFQEDSHLEAALKNGIRASLVQGGQSILALFPKEDRVRFHELFKLRQVSDDDGKSKAVFRLVDDNTESRSEALRLLKQAVKPTPRVKVRIFLDSPMSRRATSVYRSELCRPTSASSAARLYRNPALKEHLGVHTELEVDGILDELYASNGGNDAPPVTRQFLTYTLTFCKPDESEDLIFATDSPALNIVISGSGMADVGPITKHLERELSNHRSVVLLSGYASPSSVAGCLRQYSKTGSTSPGRVLRLPSMEIPDDQIQAAIEDVGAYYSGHADQGALLDFAFIHSKLDSSEAVPMTVFVNHGDDAVRGVFRAEIMKRAAERRNGDRALSTVHVPRRDHCWFDLNAGIWLEPTFDVYKESQEELLARLYSEQRRTNDLLAELLRATKGHDRGRKRPGI